ncbi:hypothetical protein Ciccas_001599 [Cichlidogyrus casuarinus]|uniref:Uncharacterized protein n=1 Tax=Cichlidogyrus casuarinus TaxID=1844966 RepID=A0ABD2QJQ8_9PLAT
MAQLIVNKKELINYASAAREGEQGWASRDLGCVLRMMRLNNTQPCMKPDEYFMRRLSSSLLHYARSTNGRSALRDPKDSMRALLCFYSKCFFCGTLLEEEAY